MCLILLAWKAHPQYELIVAANRDEWHGRPALPAQWWDDAPDLLAGKDLKAGGTWLGIARNGRFAAITNFREPGDKLSTAPSRGTLAMDFLLDDRTPEAFFSALSHHASRFNGFTLIAGDGKSLLCFDSRTSTFAEIAPGVHGLSNHTLDEPWPKVTLGRNRLGEIVKSPFDFEQLFLPLEDRRVFDDTVLPETGVGKEWERVLSSALIVTPGYGTRCSTAITVDANSHVVFEERTRDAEGAVTNKMGYVYTIVP
jgi:uncharacterized protein with NRDE domain